MSKNIVHKTTSWDSASSLGYLPDLHWHLSLWPCLKGAISQWQLYWPWRQAGFSLFRTVCTWEHDPSVVVVQYVQTFPVEKHCPPGLVAGWVCLGSSWTRVDGPDSWAWRGEGPGAVQVCSDPHFPAQHVRSASSCSRAVGLCRRSGRTKRHACSYHTFLFKCALIASIEVS